MEEEDIQVCSLDEKCGIQALERAAPDLPLSEKYIRRRECNYIRHGTQSLIGGLNLANGQVYAQVAATRTEEDFADFVEYIIEGEASDRKFIFILDQLNTHKSESIVRLMARLNGEEQYLGIKGKEGILKSMATRMRYLEGHSTTIQEQSMRIRFVFTPKHCSWLNAIEGWFSGLQKRVIQLGNFLSKDHLAEKIITYVNYYNEKLAATINWSKVSKKEIDILIRKVKRIITKLAG